MDHKQAGQLWNESAEAWTKLARAGYDMDWSADILVRLSAEREWMGQSEAATALWLNLGRR
jgi:hypothetical protein